MAPTDPDLLRASARHPQAFGELYDRHAHALLAFFARRTWDAQEAANLTAETFAAAFAARRRYRDTGAPVSAWLLGSPATSSLARAGAGAWTSARGGGSAKLLDPRQRRIVELHAFDRSARAATRADRPRCRVCPPTRDRPRRDAVGACHRTRRRVDRAAHRGCRRDRGADGARASRRRHRRPPQPGERASADPCRDSLMPHRR